MNLAGSLRLGARLVTLSSAARCQPLRSTVCSVTQLTSKLQQTSLKAVTNSCSRWSSSSVSKPPDVPYLPNEGPYPKYEETPSPYRPLFWRRYGFKPSHYQGGILPRPKEFEDVPLPPKKPVVRKSWTRRNALFGQNDYIDILGDGTLHPYHLMKGPMWLRAFKGNEFQRLRRQLKYEEEMLQEFYPRKLHDIKKRMFFLYKRVNRRRRARFWAGRKGTSWTRSRFFKLDKVF